MKVFVKYFVIFFSLMMTYTQLIEGSCYQFGHACFGAHGKRSSGNAAPQHEVRYPQSEERDVYPAYAMPRAVDYAAFNNYVRKWMERIRQELRESGLEDNLRSPVIFPQGLEPDTEK